MRGRLCHQIPETRFGLDGHLPLSCCANWGEQKTVETAIQARGLLFSGASDAKESRALRQLQMTEGGSDEATHAGKESAENMVSQLWH